MSHPDNHHPLSITGIGAVSPAGWGVPALIAAITTGHPIPTTPLTRESHGKTITTPVRRVPENPTATPKHPRLRRASPITRFAAAATLEALGPHRLPEIAAGTLRLGIIFTLTNGCVSYSNRFFTEVLADPSLASPILFPETVFNAPSSHLSTLLGTTSPNDTLIGDPTGFITGIDLAAEWITRDDVDACIVVASEEADWLSAEGLRLYHPDLVPAEGAAAILLEKAPGHPQILHLPTPISLAHRTRHQAACEIRTALNHQDDGKTLLIDGLTGIPHIDNAESLAWQNWRGPRLSPAIPLGQSMGASVAWQVVTATALLHTHQTHQAIISALGTNQQATTLLLQNP
jgi:hypothetical protein